jgi:CNT family concentrative nucleoside transporter
VIETLQSAFGLVCFIGLAWAISERRDRQALKIGAVGIGLQIVMALLLLKLPPVTAMFAYLNDAVLALQDATGAGSSFVFGYLGGGPLPFPAQASYSHSARCR